MAYLSSDLRQAVSAFLGMACFAFLARVKNAYSPLDKLGTGGATTLLLATLNHFSGFKVSLSLIRKKVVI